jgi:hypothetical protein
LRKGGKPRQYKEYRKCYFHLHGHLGLMFLVWYSLITQSGLPKFKAKISLRNTRLIWICVSGTHDTSKQKSFIDQSA